MVEPILSTFKNFMPFGPIGTAATTINNSNTDNTDNSNNYTSLPSTTTTMSAITSSPITTTQITPSVSATIPITEPENPPITPNASSAATTTTTTTTTANTATVITTASTLNVLAVENKTFAQHVQVLQKMEHPNTIIYHALSTDLPVSNLLETFQASTKKIDHWLEYANITILALDSDIKGGVGVKNASEMDVLIHKYGCNIDLLQELSQSILSKLSSDDDQNYKYIKVTFDRIHSDWIEVKTFFAKIKKEISESKQRRELLDKMDQILASIEELNTNIFEFQEQRHSGYFNDNNDDFSFPKLSTSPTPKNIISITPLTPTSIMNSNGSNSINNNDSDNDNADASLIKLDSKLEPLSARIEYLKSRLTGSNAPSDPNGILEKKYNMLNKKWESLKNEMTSIREELKEDKWSSLFKKVSGNANQMMDSLERSVKQCKDFMYRAINRSDSPLPSRYLQQQSSRGMSTSNSNYNRNNNQRSSYSNESLQQNHVQPQVAINQKNYQRLYKNFDAKRKYYIPAVTKLLTMLANGINNQMTHDSESIDKYNAMKERWDNILDGVSDIKREMPTLEYMFNAPLTSNTSPPSSIPSSIASSPPISPSMRPTGRPPSRFSPEPFPNSPPPPQRNYRPVSPYKKVVAPSEYDRSLSPPTTIAGHSSSYLAPNGHRSVSPPLNMSSQWNSHHQYQQQQQHHQYQQQQQYHQQQQYNNNYYEHYDNYYNQGYGGNVGHHSNNNHNYHGNNSYHDALLPQQRNGRSKSSHRAESPPIRPNSTRPASPDRSYASNIPRPVTSMGLEHRSPSRSGMRSILPKSTTPQPGMTSTMTRLGMVSPPLAPITSRRNPIRSPTPSSVTSSISRPITPETYDDHHYNGNVNRSMTPLSDLLSKMTVFSPELPSKYVPLKSDPLDVEVAKVVNSSPLTVKVERVSSGGGKYYFGNETVGRDRKVYLCKLVNFASGRNKVMVRVGGGWKDLDMFLLDHSLANVGI